MRPFLPRYVPDFDALLWLDADAWVQDWSAIELHLKALETHDIAATPEVDRGYSAFVGMTPAERAQPVTAWWRGVCRQFYGDEANDPWVEQPIVNAGVFAARSSWRALVTPKPPAHSIRAKTSKPCCAKSEAEAKENAPPPPPPPTPSVVTTPPRRPPARAIPATSP